MRGALSQPKCDGDSLKQNSFKAIGIQGLGVCLPDRILSNADLEKMVDTTDEWIYTRTGIRERRILSPGQAPSEIAEVAARRAMADAGVGPEDIDGVLFCTYTPDYMMPTSACLMQGRLGIPACMAFDMNAACTGFVYGLQAAYALIRSGMARRVLVIACDCASRLMDYTDRSTCILFGDGSGAAIVGEVPEGRGILGNFAGCDGKGGTLICQPIGGSAHPLTAENFANKDRYIQMNGREVFKFAVRIVQDAMDKALEDAGMQASEIDLLVMHQANIRIIHAAMERYGFGHDRVVIDIEKHGNTSSASIPVALETARQEGRLKPGTTCAFVAFGAGLTYAASIVRW